MEQNPTRYDSVNPDPANLAGMGAAEAKEYILSFITTLKLTEKEIQSLENEAARWKNRVALARSKGEEKLLAEAEKEADRINAKLAGLRAEEQSLKESIETMRKQLPGLAARERNIDTDLLEQELLMALGKTGEDTETERAFQKLEKDSAAEAALNALKEKMKGVP